MNYLSSRLSFIFSAALFASLLSASAQNPVQSTVIEVEDGPKTANVEAEIIPLIWTAKIGEATTSIPLSSIEHYCVQDYNIDNTARIRELTITTKSLSMIRVYHILPLGALHTDLGQRLEELESRLSADDKVLPIKSYPTTTHDKMVEFRVSEPGDIDVLYKSLNDTMITYLGRNLVSEQRPQIVNETSVGK